jgi:serine/threonine-protein kinase HipA
MNRDEDKRLVVVIGGQRAGSVAEGDGGRLRLTYDEDWRNGPASTPLSLSMPLAMSTHDDRVVRAFLWGLLPDNEQVLDRWARNYQVSARNPFALLRHVGEDCAGAAQFAAPDRVDELLAGRGGVDWIDEKEIARRLRTLRRDPAAWHMATAGQFSLAGAQAKTALHYDQPTRRWGDPWGAVPTTHILKPAVVSLDEHDLNEHLCLAAAHLLGLPCAASEVKTFDGERAIVLERYDRVRTENGVNRRVHQEDLCQALGRSPATKYQNEGGPTPEQVIALLRREVRPASATAGAIGRFVDALAFNWIIGGTDAHAKNYSVLLAGKQVRLAPLYDIASALPYDDMYPPKLRMAMRIGGEYGLEAIKGRHWRRFAEVNRLDPEETVTRIADLAARTPDAFATAVEAPAVKVLTSELPARLLDRVSARAQRCRVTLTQ